jgi:dCTP deaminase
MAFWCTRTLRERIEAENLIVPYDPDRVKHSAYELGVGREAYITASSKRKRSKSHVRSRVPPGEKIVIPPGQFGLLTTQEVVAVPEDSIAFISIRAGIKFRGLVNVSGFHVDPGYKDHLKFAVYNAGSQPVVLDQKQRVFMIWFSELDDVDTEPYKNKPRGRYIINSEDVTKIQGEVASPAELKKRIDELDRKLTNAGWLLGILVSIGAGILAKGFYDSYAESRKQAAAAVQTQDTPSPTPLLKQGADRPTAATDATASATQLPAADAKKYESKPKEETKTGIAQP